MIKIFTRLTPLLFIAVMGFYCFYTFNNLQKIDDWVGEYETVNANIVERKLILQKNKKKGYFAAGGAQKFI